MQQLDLPDLDFTDPLAIANEVLTFLCKVKQPL